jgi:predicted nucleotidyltransferase
MQNQPATKKLLQEMTEKIVREINPRKVVLFGSHPRGTARPDSDLDFLIVEDGPFNAQHSRREPR